MSHAFYERIRDLPVHIEASARSCRHAETSYGYCRPTTVIELSGDGHTGIGEDVTTGRGDQPRLQREGFEADLTGTYTIEEFSGFVGTLDPIVATDWNYPGSARRWALESAALDLGLRQAGTSLGARLGRSYDPVRFVVSLRLENPVSTAPIEAWRNIHSDLAFKLDVIPAWDRPFLEELSTVSGIPILDFKARFGDGAGDDDRVATDPDLYRAVVDAFSDAVFEDPLFEEPYRTVFTGHERRISWDARITGVDSVRSLPFEPSWLNIKPARFGSLQSLFETIEYAKDRDIRLYGGGMFELDRGRAHLHSLASLFYPDGPNDIAPAGYNEPEPHSDVAASPLSPPAAPQGLGF
ncbi:MAG: hypothetical protein ABEH64_14060 [Salinirussus sp.]